MRRIHWLVLAVPSALVGCGDSPDMTPDGPPDMSPGAPTTITITTGRPAALVAFHDGPRFNADWLPATMKSTTSFEAQVHGPYVVSIVCDNMFTSPAGTFESWDTLQIGRTLDDPHDITACELPATQHVLAGHMVQAGSVVAGSATATSATANWDFTLSVPNGTYDVIATTNEGVLIKRDLTVTTDMALAEPIDVAQNGTPFVTTSFSITNATASETLRATAFLETGTNSLAALLYNGPPTAATVIPSASLRATDNQTVSLRAFTTISDGIVLRAVRRPFRVGGDTSYTLPAPLVNPQWTFEEQGSGAVGVSLTWTQLSLIGHLTEEVSGTTPNGTDASCELDLTEKFVAATSTASMRIDTDIAGYKPEWRIDLKKTFTLQLIAMHIADGVTTSLSLSETNTLP